MKRRGPNLACPRCGLMTSAEVSEVSRGVLETLDDGTSIYERFERLRCQNPDCQKYFIVYSTFAMGDSGETLRSVEYFPPGQGDWPDALKHEAVPDDVEAYFKEAMKCRDAGALRASFVMLRATLQLIIRNKGITKGSLKAEIDKAKDELNLPEEIFDIADLQRLVGNDYAHPGPDTPDPDPDDAEDFVQWLGLLVDYLYVAPAKRDAIRRRHAGE